VYGRTAFLLNLGALASILRDGSHACLHEMRSVVTVAHAACGLTDAADGPYQAYAQGRSTETAASQATCYQQK